MTYGMLNDSERVAAVRNRRAQMDTHALSIATALEKPHERLVARPFHGDGDGGPRWNRGMTLHRVYPNRGTPPSAPERYFG